MSMSQVWTIETIMPMAGIRKVIAFMLSNLDGDKDGST
jgi:hypothetical protein